MRRTEGDYGRREEFAGMTDSLRLISGISRGGLSSLGSLLIYLLNVYPIEAP